MNKGIESSVAISEPAAKPRKKKNMLRRGTDTQKLVMCILPLAKLLVFAYLPLIGLVVAFQNYRPQTMFFSEFVGFENFKVVFGNPELFNLFRNAIVLNVLFVSFGTAMGVILALAMFELTRKLSLRLTQSFFYMPYFLSWPIVAMICFSLFGVNGVVTQVFKYFGKSYDFYTMPDIWPWILTMVYVWKAAGVSCISYYAVLLNNDQEIYEAADIDGASMLRKMQFISLPTLKIMIVVGLVMSCGNIIRMDFSMNYFIIGGNSLLYPRVDVLESYMYRALLSISKYGNIIAMGLLQGVIGLILSLGANYAVNRYSREASIF